MSLDIVSLGKTGLRVSEIALGTWRFGGSRTETPDVTKERAYALLDTFADHGGNFIDTADRYGGGDSEKWIGDWLENRDRDDFVIASKIGRPSLNRTDLSRRYLRQQLRQSLNRLRTDYLDILYAHRWDDTTPVDEFIGTLHGFVESGKVNYLGISTKESDAWKVAMANERAACQGRAPFVASQPRYNLAKRAIEGNYLDMCRAYGMGVMPYNALGEGFLTGKYERGKDPAGDSRAAREPTVVDRYFSEENFDLLDIIEEIAAEVDATVSQVSLAWFLHHPDVTAPVIGARTEAQLKENVRASAVSLTDEQFERLQNPKVDKC